MNNNNISFFLEEKNIDDSKNNEVEIFKMLNELELNNNDLTLLEDTNNDINNNYFNYNEPFDLMYFTNKNVYCHDENYYNIEYTVKDLIKICEYYDIDKNIKSSKCKKQDIISTIVYFESLPENNVIVHKRHMMWSYITELLNDSKMKKYVIWN